MMPELSGVDHCHLEVRDMDEALKWYEKVLGMKVVPELAFWYEGDGPLTLQDAKNSIRLALFCGETASGGIAFGATGGQFLAWLEHLERCGLKYVLADHKVTYSVYFRDPSGNRHEITSHDHAQINAGLNG